MLIYLAGPIDAVKTRDEGRVRYLRRVIQGDLSKWNVASFDPSRPYQDAGAAPRAVQAINDAAIQAADGLLAILPPGIPSVGTPMEIAAAHRQGKPVAVIGGGNSLMLEAMENVRVYDLEGGREAIPWLLETAEARRHPIMIMNPENAGPLQNIVKWTGEDECKPLRHHDGDAGFDLICSEDTKVPAGEFRDLPCGISVELPPNVWAMITGRSSTIRRRGLLIAQGIIDSGYRGPIFSGCWNLTEGPVTVCKGDRVAQLIPFPLTAATLTGLQVSELSESDRGESGFGSTGV